jgi:hypothetical protein
MRKATLSPNPIPQNKQRFIVEGLKECNRVITRDNITLELAAADRPDKTSVPIGRIANGDFGITLDFADDLARRDYLKWFEMCVDKGSSMRQTGAATRDLTGSVIADAKAKTYDSVEGINKDYKKLASVIYHRLYKGKEQPIVLKLIGCWPKSIEAPDFDMDGEDLCTLSMTISFDDAEIITDGVNLFGNTF